LGQFSEAKESLRKSAEFVAGVLREDRGNRQALMTSAEIVHDQMVLAVAEQRREDVMAYARDLSARLDLLGRQGSERLARAVASARAYRGAASVKPPPVGELQFAWGDNQFGQLGDGKNTSTSLPIETTRLTEVTAIAAGWYHNMALRSDGTVWTWGRNSDGQLGIGSMAHERRPVAVRGLGPVVAIAAGAETGMAVRSDSTLWTWGANEYGQLGNGTTTTSSLPVKVLGLSKVVAMAGGRAHSLALGSDGTVWAWGSNGYGQLGNGSTTQCTIPIHLSGLREVVAISAGNVHSLALTRDGSVWAWGSNHSGQLGLGRSVETSNVPTRISGLSGVAAIAAGVDGSVALGRDGTVWVWGVGLEADTLQDRFTGNDVPVRVPFLTGVVAVATAMATPRGVGGYQLALRNDGTVWGWGFNAYGVLGNGSHTNCALPVLIPGLQGVVAIAAGGAHGLAMTR